MEVATDLIFHIVMYIRVKQIIKKDLFNPSIVDWMEADLNKILSVISPEDWKMRFWLKIIK